MRQTRRFDDGHRGACITNPVRVLETADPAASARRRREVKALAAEIWEAAGSLAKVTRRVRD
jgi:hypothetical protein